MCRIRILVAAFTIVVSGAHAQERQPFHIARFSDSRTIGLAITSSATSDDRQYDFEVDIDLTERASGGAVIFVDHGSHAVRVRCRTPESVKVGGSVHFILPPPGSGDWMQDLWKALCQQPVS